MPSEEKCRLVQRIEKQPESKNLPPGRTFSAVTGRTGACTPGWSAIRRRYLFTLSEPLSTSGPAPRVLRTALHRSLLIAGIVLIAFNLRPALAAVGPLIAYIRQDTGLSNTALGLLTTLPVLAFGMVSAFMTVVTRRLGMEATLAASMGLLSVGIGLRMFPSVWLLFGGTALLGVAIASGNVLLPSLVKRDFPEYSGVMTSVYSGAMGLGAALGAGVSVPLAGPLGWRGALGAWALPAVAALIMWLPQLAHRTRPRPTRTLRGSFKDLGRSWPAWQVALFMGLQSLTFYAVLAWLPEILQSRGLGAGYAGWMLALSQGAGILGAIVIPVWADRLARQGRLVGALAVLEGIGLAGILFPGGGLAPLWVALIGFVLGGSFGLALLFIVLRSADTETAAELSGMAQSVGYLLAAAGPALFGFLRDVTLGWSGPLLFLMFVLLARTGMGLGAARPQRIHIGGVS